MPFFNDDPIDPGLSLKGDIGPGLDNDETDRIKVASAIEKRTGAAPYADLGTFGEGLADSFSKNSGKKRDTSLTPGFLGATMAAQVRKGTDPDGVILKNGPTRDALIRKDNLPRSGSLFAPLPKVKAPIGPKQPNRPEDLRKLQGKLANTGYVPRVADRPLFQNTPTQRTAPKPLIQQQLGTEATKGQTTTLADGLNALLDGVERYQRAKGLKPDRLVNPGGPTEQTLDAQNEKARKARLDLFTDVSRKVLESEDPKVRDIANKHAADAMAGLIVGKKVVEQGAEKHQSANPTNMHQSKPDGVARAETLRTMKANKAPSNDRSDVPRRPMRLQSDATGTNIDGFLHSLLTHEERFPQVEEGDRNGLTPVQFPGAPDEATAPRLTEKPMPDASTLDKEKTYGVDEPITFDGTIYKNTSRKFVPVTRHYRTNTRFLGVKNAVVFRTVTKVPGGGYIARKVYETGIPLGITTMRQFSYFSTVAFYGTRMGLYSKYGSAVASSAIVGIRGSAVVGRKFRRSATGESIPFRLESDIYLFIVSPRLLAEWRKIATKERIGGGRRGSSLPLSDDELRKLGLLSYVITMRAILGRPKLTFKIFTSEEETRQGHGPGRSGRESHPGKKPPVSEGVSTFVYDNHHLARLLFRDHRKIRMMLRILSAITSRYR